MISGDKKNKKGEKLIRKGESQNIEFKESWRDEYLKWICAFANTSGGILYIGVADNGEVTGVEDAKKMAEDIPNKIRSTMWLVCSVALETENGRNFIAINVEKYPFPVSYHGKYYKRSGSTLQELSGLELDKMILSVQGRTWDSLPVLDASMQDLDKDSLNLFRKKALAHERLDSESINLPDENLIQNLRGFEGKNLTRAVLLAFACDPERWFTGAYIKIAFFENEADILYQDEIHGSLMKQVDESLAMIY